MTAAQPRLHLTRRSWIILATGLAAVAALAVHVSRSTHQRAMERLEGQARAYLAALDEVDFDREAAWGETVEGAAFPHVQAAVKVARSLDASHWSELQRIARAIEAGTAPEAADLAAIEEPAREALAHLRAAASARDARIDPMSAGGYAVVTSDTGAFEVLGTLALAKLLAADSVEEQIDGVRTILDLQQVSRDVLVSPEGAMEMVALKFASGLWLQECLAFGILGRLDDRAIAEWLAGLRHIEGSIPEAPTLQPTIMYSLAGKPVEADASPLRTRIIEEAGVDPHWAGETEAALARIRPAFQSAFQRARADTLMAEMARLEGQLDLDEEAYHAGMRPRLDVLASSWTIARGRLALLRHGLELHLGEANPAGVDPFGTGVTVKRQHRRIELSSEVTPGGQTIKVIM